MNISIYKNAGDGESDKVEKCEGCKRNARLVRSQGGYRGRLIIAADELDDLAGDQSPELPIFEATLLPAVPKPFSIPS